MMRKTLAILVLTASLAGAQQNLEALLTKLVTTNPKTWSKTIGKPPTFSDDEFDRALQKAAGLYQQGRQEEAWALMGAADWVDWAAKGKARYHGAGQLALLRLFQRDSQPQLAYQYAQKLVKEHPELAAAHASLGVMQLSRNEDTLALQSFQKAVELDPELTAGYMGLAHGYMRRGEVEPAKAALRKVLELDPQNALATDVLQGMSKGEEVLTQSPEAQRHFDKAEEHFRAHRFQQAVVEYDLAIAADPKFAKAHIYKGDAYYQMGDLARAVECYRTAIQVDPKDRQAHRFLGDVLEREYDRTGEVKYLDEAIESFQNAVILDPSYQMAKQDLERAKSKRARRQ